jgi:hypothetical protein
VWTVTAQGVTWELDFVHNKTFLEMAPKLKGKSVLVTGTLAARAPQNPYGTYANPYAWPSNEFLRAHQPYQYPYPWGYGTPPMPVLKVETFKAAD